jgi:hypothetical protein
MAGQSNPPRAHDFYGNPLNMAFETGKIRVSFHVINQEITDLMYSFLTFAAFRNICRGKNEPKVESSGFRGLPGPKIFSPLLQLAQ